MGDVLVGSGRTVAACIHISYQGDAGAGDEIDIYLSDTRMTAKVHNNNSATE